MSRLRVIVNGAQGKMGQLATRTLTEHPDFELVAKLGRADHLSQVIVDTAAQIVVDLTSAEAVYQNTLTIIEHGACPVIGSSGLLPEQYLFLKSICDSQSLGGLIVPNFSIAAVLMMHFSAIAARYLPDVEIIEAHHPQKKDAPSGTAIKTADAIAHARHQASSLPICHEIIPGARGAHIDNIPVHSVRISGVLAEQEVLFGAPGETFHLVHRSIDRHCFMPGLVLACQKVAGLPTLYYGLEHLLNLS